MNQTVKYCDFWFIANNKYSKMIHSFIENLLKLV